MLGWLSTCWQTLCLCLCSALLPKAHLTEHNFFLIKSSQQVVCAACCGCMGTKTSQQLIIHHSPLPSVKGERLAHCQRNFLCSWREIGDLGHTCWKGFHGAEGKFGALQMLQTRATQSHQELLGALAEVERAVASPQTGPKIKQRKIKTDQQMEITLPRFLVAALVCVLAMMPMFFRDLRVVRDAEDALPLTVKRAERSEFVFLDQQQQQRNEHSQPHLRHTRAATNLATLPCASLYPSMLCCLAPAIDPSTQQAAGCSKDGTVFVPCFARPGVVCENKTSVVSPTNASDDTALCGGVLYLLNSSVTNAARPCKHVSPTNPKDFEVALALSVFLGMFGADRFYLGYPAIGLAKLATFGFLCIGQLLDIILIALQIVGPADGSAYRMPHYGPGVTRVYSDDETYLT
eukprot:m.106260 g.106260  ORF g.106260 m.106260 type:complete len:405 (-) comp14219_c0_seq9:128-1342(-)